MSGPTFAERMSFSQFDLNKHSVVFAQTIDRILSSIPVSSELRTWLIQVKGEKFHPYFWRDVSAPNMQDRHSILPLTHPISDNDLKALNLLWENVPGFTYGPADPTKGRFALSVTLNAEETSRKKISQIVENGGNPISGQAENAEAMLRKATSATSSLHAYRAVKMSELAALIERGEDDKAMDLLGEGQYTTAAGDNSVGMRGAKPILLINDLPQEQSQYSSENFTPKDFDSKGHYGYAGFSGGTWQSLPEAETIKSILNFFLPISSSENIAGKIQRHENIKVIEGVEFAVDIVFSISFLRLLKMLKFAPQLAQKVLSREFREIFMRETVEKFAENSAKKWAARRIMLRKMAAEPDKYARLANRDAVNLTLKESMPTIEKYGTKPLGKLGTYLKDKGIVKGATQTTVKQAAKSALFGAIITDLSYESVKSASRAVELLASDNVPPWLEKENPLIARIEDPTKRRVEALNFIADDLKAFWGIFKGVSWTVHGMQKVAPYLSKGMAWAKEGVSDSEAISAFTKSFKADLAMMDAEATAAARNFWEILKTAGKYVKPAPGSMPMSIGYSTMSVLIEIIGAEKSQRRQTEAHGIATKEFLVPKGEYAGITVVDGGGRPLPSSKQESALEKNVLATYNSEVSVARTEAGKPIEENTFDMVCSALSPPDFSLPTEEGLLSHYEVQVQSILDRTGVSFEEFRRLNNRVFVPAARLLGIREVETLNPYEPLRKIISSRTFDNAAEHNLSSFASKYYLRQYDLYFNAYSLARHWLSSPSAMQNELASLQGRQAFEKEWNSMVAGATTSELPSTIPMQPGSEGQHSCAMYVIFKYILMSILPHDILEKAPVYTGRASRGE